MKCAEVIEWMHRYLDHDLSHEEITEMYRHIDACPSCADVFDRLTTLSRQLEQLPDVKAPFSLVDSIMPQLDELDRQRLEAGKKDAAGDVVVPFTRSASQDKRRKGSALARRTGIGAAAAAIILGIAIFNMPEQMPGAQVETMLSQDSASSKADNSSAERSMEASNADMADSGAAQNTPASAAGMNEDTADMYSSAVAGGADTSSQNSGDMNSDVASESTAPRISKKESVSSLVTPSASSPGQRKLGDSGQEQPGSAGAATATASPVQSPEKDVYMTLIAPTTEPGALSWTSADGRHMAVVEGEKLAIYNISANKADKALLTTVPLEGKWVSGEWLADNLQFNYVTQKDGIEVKNVFTIPQVDTSSTPLPSGSPAATGSDTPSETPSIK
ncbi:anti-sigma factor family protein [Paenibacillus sp. sgz500958]|uniref:anti-sigma factor family protein n=1 Tax=Paenibacillus sp. sgz500958 TaxID=3242475 RepID=UPI0036D38F39